MPYGGYIHREHSSSNCFLLMCRQVWRRLHNRKSTLDTKFTKMVQDNLYFIRRLLSNDGGLEIAFVNTDDQRHSNIVCKNSFGQRDVNFLLSLLGQPKIFSTYQHFYLTFPFSSNYGYLYDLQYFVAKLMIWYCQLPFTLSRRC